MPVAEEKEVTSKENRKDLLPTGYSQTQLNRTNEVYLSYDSPIHRNLNGDHIEYVHTPGFLNTVTASGLPNHKLRLKVGVPVMLLRNIDTRYGLWNGTILVITRMRRYVIEGRVIYGSNVGDQVFVSSQGQSLKHVGVYLPTPVFSHRQLYVAISRVTSREGLKILTADEDSEDTNVTSNVVYEKVFHNV
ncbi:PIF1-like helicase [Medicago truncatula]|uniref:PIF1-like helicase n=1 Tax=Medicago truncatula TaxID=3880 RepID=G7L762_MEDTR|nr:PIF1-like helicase [Medicago truncatula]